MNTLNDTPPAVTIDAPEPEFGEGAARLAAAALLAKGHSAEDVREYAADRPEAGYMWRPIAGAMDALAAEG